MILPEVHTHFACINNQEFIYVFGIFSMHQFNFSQLFQVNANVREEGEVLPGVPDSEEASRCPVCNIQGNPNYLGHFGPFGPFGLFGYNFFEIIPFIRWINTRRNLGHFMDKIPSISYLF